MFLSNKTNMNIKIFKYAVLRLSKLCNDTAARHKDWLIKQLSNTHLSYWRKKPLERYKENTKIQQNYVKTIKTKNHG